MIILVLVRMGIIVQVQEVLMLVLSVLLLVLIAHKLNV